DVVERCSRDAVAWEGVPAERVANGDAFLAEVAIAQRLGRDGVQYGGLTRKAKRFPGEVEERPVPAVVDPRKPDRPSKRSTEGVSDLRRQSRLAEAAGVERAILVIPKSGAVKSVRAAFGGSGDVAGGAVFRAVPNALHTDLGDRFDGGKEIAIRAVAGNVGDGDAID